MKKSQKVNFRILIIQLIYPLSGYIQQTSRAWYMRTLQKLCHKLGYSNSLFYFTYPCLILDPWKNGMTLHFKRKNEYLNVSNIWTRTSIQHQYSSPTNIGHKGRWQDALLKGHSSLTICLQYGWSFEHEILSRLNSWYLQTRSDENLNGKTVFESPRYIQNPSLFGVPDKVCSLMQSYKACNPL